MKITKEQLRQIIKEELKEVIEEVEFDKEEFERGYQDALSGSPPPTPSTKHHKDYKLGFKDGVRDATLRGPLAGIGLKEESPKILHDKEIGHYYMDGREVVFTDKDGAERENVPLVVKQRARVKRAQGKLK